MADPAAWHALNKRRQFLGKYVSRNFQRDYEDTVGEPERSTITFAEMVKKVSDRYKPTQNTTLTNFEFHKLKQNEGERFDDFLNRVKQEAHNCHFSCASPTCDVMETLIRDQVVIGTSNDEIRRNALKEQWKLEQLGIRGRQLEAASHGANQIVRCDKVENGVIHKVGGKYSKKTRMRQQQQEQFDKQRCNTCSGHSCKGGKYCFAFKRECYGCGEVGHMKGSRACKQREDHRHGKGRHSRRVHQDSESDTVSSGSDSSGASPDSEDSTSEDDHRVKRLKEKGRCRYIAHVRRIHPKRAKQNQSSRYRVEIILKEARITAFADTGADVCVISERLAKELKLDLDRANLKLRPYGSKSIRCKQAYIGTVMYEGNTANVKFYVVPKDVETPLRP